MIIFITKLLPTKSVGLFLAEATFSMLRMQYFKTLPHECGGFKPKT